MRILSIEFEYKGIFYYALIRVKEKTYREYHITVMNGPLEQLLYGSHIIIEVNGSLQVDLPSENNEQGKLKLAIASALRQYLQSNDLLISPGTGESRVDILQ